MATVKSDVVTNLDSTNPAVNVIDVTLKHGRLRLAAFSYDTGASGPATSDVIQLVKVPKGARIFGIYIMHDAMTSGAGTAGADYGDGGDVDRFVAARDMDAANTGVWLPLRQEDANLDAKTLGFGYKYADADTVDAVVTGEAWAANKRLDGFVLYSTD